MPKTATIVRRGHPSRTLLNLLASFFHLPNFDNVLSPLHAILLAFIFAVVL